MLNIEHVIQLSSEPHGPSQEVFSLFNTLRKNLGKPTTMLKVQIRTIAFLIFSSFKRKFELKGFKIA